ncbi:ABC transporter transmembrane domain-containing protein [Hoeflea prorocentri]|uniref:ABC transporter ATP-binding protein n=1 Tax=Hoeflea prorocentri TaxID=1922333 RepID=A0A9X3ZHU3_9HYPH|nr:ABC transporter ATP-binding protein [Hoeflea prorocentri]MCY6381196.1 ABC transporter ATP-binding protein [Hoeflea prorocentri]MDA5398996.1 ABC transporter ATP-binding protein [Hoeflea prorocentri]
MSIPVLWTGRRLLQLAGLASIGVVQAASALTVAFAGSRLLTGAGQPDLRPALLAAVIGGTTLLILGRILQRRYAEAFALGYVTELRTALISHILRIPADARQMRSGLVMTRVVNDLSAIKLWLASGLVAMVVAGAMLATIIALLTQFEPALAVLFALAFGLWVIPVIFCLRPLNKRIRESRRRRGRIAARAGSILNGRLTLLGFGRHGPVVRGIEKRSLRLNKALVGRATFSGLMRSSGDLIFPSVVVFASGLVFSLPGRSMDAVSLGVLAMTTGLLATHLSSVALGLEYRLAHRVAMERLKTVLGLPTIELDQGENLEPLPDEPCLRLDKMPVGPLDRPVSFTALPGERLALTGLSEAEALDLVLKISRLKPKGGGGLFLFGNESASIRPRTWLRNIASVSPGFPLVKGSVASNVALGAPSDVDGEEVQRVLSAFGITACEAAREVREDGRLFDLPAHCVRAARAVLRRSKLVLIADADLAGDVEVFESLLLELAKRDVTVVLAGDPPLDLVQRFHRIDLTPRLSRVA